MNFRHLLPRLVIPFMGALAACSGSGNDEAPADESDLTSLTARTRTLAFNGYVYVVKGASDTEILATVRAQTQSAFGALRTVDVGTNSRELKDVNPSTFVKTDVSVVDSNGQATQVVRVDYSFTDQALVPKTMATRSALSVGLLGNNYKVQKDRILKECTENKEHDREFRDSVWYVFNPSLSQCKLAMAKEQQTIDSDRSKLADPKAIPTSELTRLYIPVTVSLQQAAQNARESYPEYDRLYTGGVKRDRLVIGMVSGLMADWAAGDQRPTVEDDGYPMWLEGLREIFKVRPEFKLTGIDPQEDLTAINAWGKRVTDVTFDKILSWELDQTGFPAEFATYEAQKTLRQAVGQRIVQHWLRFEAPVTVKIGNAPPKQFTIELNTYFGSDQMSAPYKQAIKNSDVFIYNGHSYIGYGPLDPSRFTAADFPSSYQIMFINGCVSYNYYEKDYFPLKGGSANLDLVTNGLESWVNESGPAVARFVATLINGQQSSYKMLLKSAQFTQWGYDWGMDALRVVDGELDNRYTPARLPISVTPR